MKNRLFSALAILGLVASTALVGCGDACDDAADKAEECFPDAAEGAEGSAECSGTVECAATCFADASCDEIKAPTADGAYTKCVAACQ